MIDKELMSKVIDYLISGGGDFAEIFLEKRENFGISLENKKIEKIVSGKKTGAGIRFVSKGKTFFAFTEDLRETSLYKIAKDLVNKNSDGNIKKNQSLNLITADDSYLYRKITADTSIEEKLEQIIHMNQVAWNEVSHLNQLMINYGQGSQDIYIMNSKGVFIKDFRPRVKLIAQGIFEKDGQIQSSYDAIGALGDHQFIKNRNLDDFILNIIAKGENLLNAEGAPSGTMPVVISGDAGGTMVHEACGHGLEADIVKKGMSVYADKIGQKVASEKITVIDDGTIKGRYGTGYFDDEGTKTKENVLIENGILKGYITDILSAEELKIPLTGNGRREGYHALPITRMTNTYIKSGDDESKNIIASVEDGLYVHKMGGGQVNTANGDFVFEVTEGYLIKNGKLDKQVKGATLIGNGPDVLNRIDMVGDDFGYSLGTCGKDGQGVPVADGQPTLRIPGLVVGGVQ